jgi:hypothetical protein
MNKIIITKTTTGKEWYSHFIGEEYEAEINSDEMACIYGRFFVEKGDFKLVIEKKIKPAKIQKPAPITAFITGNKTVELVNVTSVYRGVAGACACGCKGNYRYAKAHQKWAGENRGYEVTDDEVNDTQVKKIFNLFASNVVDVEDYGDGRYSLTMDTKAFTVYTLGTDKKSFTN